jgi:hypothetical protein
MPRLPKLPPNIAQLQRGVRHPAWPEPGWFKLRLARRGPWIPAIIERIDHEPGNPENILDTGPILVATIGDRDADPLEVWERGSTITEQEYRWRLALRDWANAHAPEQPEAKPHKEARLDKLPSLF